MKNYKPYLAILIFLFILYFLPSSCSNRLRHKSVAWIATAFKKFPFFIQKPLTSLSEKQQEIQHLKALEAALRDQIETVREILISESRIEKQIEMLEFGEQKERSSLSLRKKSKYLYELLQRRVFAIPAKVVYREPMTWNHYLWINVGELDNQNIGEAIIAKNSPVVVGNNVLGVIEDVQSRRSKVRLITDSSMTISVRASRGEEQNIHLLQFIDELEKGIDLREDLFCDLQEKKEIKSSLQLMKDKIKSQSGFRHLAKGQIQGTGYPLWRMPSNVLQGTGFNYEYADEEGGAIKLRSHANSILQIGDLLVTTGFDGIFPKGLFVGTIIYVDPLKEEDFAYKLKARAAIENIHEIEFVSVLPPMTFEEAQK